MSFAFEVLAANEMADQMYSLKVGRVVYLHGPVSFCVSLQGCLICVRNSGCLSVLAAWYLGFGSPGCGWPERMAFIACCALGCLKRPAKACSQA
jgi:hypothetical protein